MLKGKFLRNLVTFPEMHIKPKATEIQQSRSSVLKNSKFSESSRVWPFAPKDLAGFLVFSFFFPLHTHASNGMHVAK